MKAATKQDKDIIMKFKYLNLKTNKKGRKERLKKLAQEALQQIEERNYACGKDAVKIGLAYCGKEREIVWSNKLLTYSNVEWMDIVI